MAYSSGIRLCARFSKGKICAKIKGHFFHTHGDSLSRGRKFLDDRHEGITKFEKMKKEKRSIRGRTVDDWIFDSDKDPGALRRGRVIEVHKKHIFVAEEKEHGVPDTGLLWLCTVAKRHFQRVHKERNFVVVGDVILFEPDRELQLDEAGEPIDADLPRGVIQHAFERKSAIVRKDPLRPDWEHVMLANIDLLVIVASVQNPEVRWGLIDRFITQAEYQGVEAVIVLNKTDLLKDEDEPFVKNYERRVSIYKNLGYDVFQVSALRPKSTKSEVLRLREKVKGNLIGFSGHSGVGKSSILNLMKPEFDQIVDENPEIFYKGRHTTTYNSLLKLGIGAYAIDTPGIRSYANHELDPITLSACFREFAGIKCKFRECSHVEEESCAVKEAVRDGRITHERYRSYVGILRGVSLREGEGDDSESEVIADLKARQQMVDAEEE